MQLKHIQLTAQLSSVDKHQWKNNTIGRCGLKQQSSKQFASFMLSCAALLCSCGESQAACERLR